VFIAVGQVLRLSFVFRLCDVGGQPDT